MIDPKTLYERIDKEEDMTDQEKRDTYFAELSAEKDREEWENSQNPW